VAERGHQVAVAIERRGDRRVAEPGLDLLRVGMDARLDQSERTPDKGEVSRPNADSKLYVTRSSSIHRFQRIRQRGNLLPGRQTKLTSSPGAISKGNVSLDAQSIFMVSSWPPGEISYRNVSPSFISPTSSPSMRILHLRSLSLQPPSRMTVIDACATVPVTLSS